MRRVIVGYDETSNKYRVFRSSAAMTINLSWFCHVSGKGYGEPLSDPICICGFERALSAGKIINFGDLARPVMDCIQQLSIFQIVHSQIVPIYFVT